MNAQAREISWMYKERCASCDTVLRAGPARCRTADGSMIPGGGFTVELFCDNPTCGDGSVVTLHVITKTQLAGDHAYRDVLPGKVA